MATVLTLVAATGVAVVASAVADPAPDVAQAVVSARTSAKCGALRYDPMAEHAAEIINRSIYSYLNHTAENAPEEDPHPVAIAKDVGIKGNKVISLKGAAHNEANAIKGVLLEGRDAIPDCSYTSFGTSSLREEQSDYILAVVVLAGP